MSVARSMSLGGRIGTVLNIQLGEGRLVAVMMLYSAVAMGGVLTIAPSVSRSLFVSTLPPSALPFLFILPAVCIAPTMLLYNFLASRWPLRRMTVGSIVTLLVVMVAFRLVLSTPLGSNFWTLALFYLVTEIAQTLILLQFWTLVGETLNPRQAKRLSGLISAGGTMSRVLAGLVLGGLVGLIGVANLLWLVVASLAVCAACALTLMPTSTAGRSPAQGQPPSIAPTSLPASLRAIRRSPLLVVIAGLTVVLSLLINTAAYQFYLTMQSAYTGRSAELVAFLAAYEIWAGLAALFVQVYLTRYLLKRFGVSVALLGLPLGMGLGGVLLVLSGGAWWASTLIRATDPVFRRTITTTAINMLYMPLPPRLRQGAKELFESLYAVSFGLLGVVFLLLQQASGWTVVDWGFPLVGLSVAWVVLVRLARQPYRLTLAQNIRRRLTLDTHLSDITDPATVHVLSQALAQPDDFRVLQALDLINRLPEIDWIPYVAPLLAHPSDAVKIGALRYLSHREASAQSEAVAALFDQGNDEVRAAAIEAFCQINRQRAIPHVVPYLHEPNPMVRAAAMIGLIRSRGLDGILYAAEALKALLTNEHPLERAEGARVLGALGVQHFYDPLFPLFDDPSLVVQVEAVKAAGAIGVPELAPYVVRKLGERPTASAATDALIQFGPAVEPLLADTLADAHQPHVARRRVPRILQRLGTQSAADILLRHLHDSDAGVRSEVYRGLAHLHSLAGVTVNRASLYDALLTELRAVYAWYLLRDDLALVGDAPLLQDALTTRFEQGLDRVLSLLGILYPELNVEEVRYALRDGSPGVSAQALELLDAVVERRYKELVLPLIEAPMVQVRDIARKQLGLTPKSVSEGLLQLIDHDDSWLRCCAVYQIGVLGLRTLRPAVVKALEAGDPLLRETAKAVLDRWGVQPIVGESLWSS